MLTGMGPHAGADRTLAADSAGPVKTAYVEPVAVGDTLPAMPLFLTREGVPELYRRVLEAVE
jgi:hypothetical protein